jgi:hypothetical protein
MAAQWEATACEWEDLLKDPLGQKFSLYAYTVTASLLTAIYYKKVRSL